MSTVKQKDERLRVNSTCSAAGQAHQFQGFSQNSLAFGKNTLIHYLSETQIKRLIPLWSVIDLLISIWQTKQAQSALEKHLAADCCCSNVEFTKWPTPGIDPSTPATWQQYWTLSDAHSDIKLARQPAICADHSCLVRRFKASGGKNILKIRIWNLGDAQLDLNVLDTVHDWLYSVKDDNRCIRVELALVLKCFDAQPDCRSAQMSHPCSGIFRLMHFLKSLFFHQKAQNKCR